MAWESVAEKMEIGDLTRFVQDHLVVSEAMQDFLRAGFDRPIKQCIVVGPTGIGKTLLLRVKREMLAATVPNIRFIPRHRDTPISRPTGTLSALSRGHVGRMIAGTQFWKSLWMHSIALAVCHALDRKTLETADHKFLREMGRSVTEYTPGLIFNRMLDQNIERYEHISRVCNQILYPVYGAIRRKVAIFIDNVDSYFSLTSLALASGKSLERNQAQRIWVLSQVGLAEAILELSNENPNVRIFASLRSEALMRAHPETSAAQKIEASCVKMDYSVDNLRDIFRKNIALTVRDKLALPDSEDLIERFMGRDGTYVTNFSGDIEDIFEFILRHTMKRPRDLMVVGELIGKISVDGDGRRDADKIKEAVYRAAASSVMQHVSDAAPFEPTPDMDALLQLIPKNVLSFDELEKVAEEYKSVEEQRRRGEYGRDRGLGGDPARGHPFCALFSLGLLGVLRSARGGLRQEFRGYSSRMTGYEHQKLPKSDKYLIHPALDEMIYRFKGEEYRSAFDRLHVVGDDIEWSLEDERYYICMGDIVLSSDVGESKYDSYLETFEHYISMACHDLKRGIKVGGDGVLMIDRSPHKILTAASELAWHVQRAAHNALPRGMRFGGTFGKASNVEAGIDNKMSEPSGWAIRTSQRILSVGKPGYIFLDGAFISNSISRGNKAIDSVERVEAHELPEVVCNDRIFSIKKSEEDTPYVTELWKVNLLKRWE